MLVFEVGMSFLKKISFLSSKMPCSMSILKQIIVQVLFVNS